MDDDTLTLTVGPTSGGVSKLAVISAGGHPQRPGSGECIILAVEKVEGWGRRKVEAWFERMKIERPWETRQ